MRLRVDPSFARLLRRILSNMPRWGDESGFGIGGGMAIVDSIGRIVAQGAEVHMTAHFFTAPIVNPLTNDLWSTRNTTTIGNTMTSDAAVSCPHSTPSSVKNW